jgi:hypothetical protein
VVKEKEMRRFGFLAAAVALTVFCTSFVQAAINVTYNVNTDANKTPISKYVYGSNWGGGTDYTIRRSGGNRLTGYNWENNFSNAGADWYHSNDRYLVQDIPPAQQLVPGIAITSFHDAALSQGQASVVTLQMAGYVSADDYGEVNLAQTAPSSRWKKVVYAKGAPFCNPPGSPNTVDANVYMDEFINFLVSKYGHAGEPNGVKFYDLDNEPDIWSDGAGGGTHPRIHPVDPCCLELKDRSVALSTAVKNVDPNAQIMGPVSYGFEGYRTFQGASDWGSQGSGYKWFLSYYLDKMKAASGTAGKRLLDALDVHWYPEAQDVNGVRITEFRNYRANWDARMQAPRSLWDYDYSENSWIHTWYHSWLPILPPLKTSIDTNYPDTNLAITEYAYGGEDHYSGGIATADVLGIFGKYGVYVATYWGEGTYVDAAIKMFRKYDFRTNATFGDMNVPATMSNKVDSSIYASIFDSNNNVLHLIVTNKNFDNDINGTFNITSSHSFTSGRIWAFDMNGSDIMEMRRIDNITSNSFKYLIPRLSVCHIVLDGPPCPMQFQCELTENCYVDKAELDILCDQWLHIGDCSADPQCADFNGDEIVDFLDFAVMGQEWKS